LNVNQTKGAKRICEMVKIVESNIGGSPPTVVIIRESG